MAGGGASVKMSLSGGQNAKMPMCTVRASAGRRRAYITIGEGRTAANYVSANGPRGHNRLRLRRRKGRRSMRHSLLMPRSTNLPVCGGLPDEGGCGGVGRGRVVAAANSFKIHCHLGVGWKDERGHVHMTSIKFSGFCTPFHPFVRISCTI